MRTGRRRGEAPVYDALVVGAGPAGSTCAERLAARGHAVALVDENQGAREAVVCTGIIGREAFERVGLPKAPVVDVIRRARFVSPSGLAVDYEPPNLLAEVVSRTAFDRSLVGRAARAGARVLWGHAVRDVETDAGGVTVTAKTEAGERHLWGRALVVATGHQRWLHEDAGLGLPPGYVHGVHADLPFRDLAGAELYFGNAVAPGFFAWAVPFGEGTARVGVLARQGAREHFQRFLRLPPIRDRLSVELDERGWQAVGERLRSRGIVQGVVSPSYADRTLAVGEAAGQVKTTTGGGIYYGILGARIAAEIMDDALRRDRLGPEDLRVYERRWRDRLDREIESGLSLQRTVGGLTDHEIDRIFRALRGGFAATIREVVRFDWHRPALGVLFRHPQLLRHARRGDAAPGRMPARGPAGVGP